LAQDARFRHRASFNLNRWDDQVRALGLTRVSLHPTLWAAAVYPEIIEVIFPQFPAVNLPDHGGDAHGVHLDREYLFVEPR
jgi:hypothetical protein